VLAVLWNAPHPLTATQITARLPAGSTGTAYPKEGGWTVSTVTAILANPKYTGHQVFGRRRRIPGSGRARRFRTAPREQWLWSPAPVHPAIITRALWEAAQDIGAEHASASDDLEGSAQPPQLRAALADPAP
jgi:hypothetical protein